MGFNISIGSGGGIIGKLFSSAFGMVFVLFGFFFIRQEIHSLQETKAMQEWPKTTCTIVASDVEDYGEDFQLALSYTYTVEGKTYTGERYGKNDSYTAETIGEIKQAQDRWAVGKTTDVYYNPAHPSDAVLVLPTVGESFGAIGFASIFAAVGLLFAIAPWLRSRRRKQDTTMASGTSPKSQRAILILFGLVFTMVGLAMIKPLMITPLLQAHDARSWISTPATVVSSKVKSHSSDDGTTYSAYIAYRYEVDGKEYFGDRLNLMKISSSGYDAKAEIVRQYPEGREFIVFVNPDDPSESVIHPEASLSLLFCLFPLPFLIAGLFVLGFGLRNKKPRLDMAQAHTQVVALKYKSPATKAVGLTIFTLFWLGIVYFLAHSDAPRLFPIAFGFFGLLLVIGSIHAILQIFTPKPAVELTPGNMHPGTTAALRWRIAGRADRIGTMTVTLRCLKVETQTTRSGGETSTSVVKTPLFEQALLEARNQFEIVQGAMQFTIPAEQPPSRPGNHDGIQWLIEFHGAIARWPDMKCELPFTVYPQD